MNAPAAVPPDQYEALLQCYRSGQVSEKQWALHLKDEIFAAWLAEKMREEQS